MKTLQDNYMIDGFMGIDYATAPSYFATGKAAMLADGSWDAPTVAAESGAEIRLLPASGYGRCDQEFLLCRQV